MEQLNKDLSVVQEEKQIAAESFYVRNQESPLLNKVRQKFGTYATISIIFGGVFALLFYKTLLGINVLLFASLTVILLSYIMKQLSLTIKVGTKLYFAGVLLLGLSATLTSKDILLLLNILGILFLLDLALLHQLNEDKNWNFAKHIGKMFGLLFLSIITIAMPIIDGVNFLKHTRILKNDLLRNVLLGLIVSVPMLLIITSLLSGADLIFGKFTKNIFEVMFSADIIGVVFMVVFGFFACYCILCGALSRAGMEEKKAMEKADPTIGITFMTMLCLVYAVFCGIQLVYLFANGVLTLPAEFTFAEYARKGFFELLAVTIINIVLMLFCNTVFKDSKLLRLLIAFMTACTYIMIASATYRMILYIGAYQLTFLRLFVLLTLFIDALILAGIILSQYKKEFPLFRYCVIVISICYLTFSFAKPDYIIASYLVNQKEVLNIEDMVYLTKDLSLDAAPVVLPLITNKDRWDKTSVTYSEYYNADQNTTYQLCAKDYYTRIFDAETNTGIRDFNYSYFKANEYANKFTNKY